MGPQGDLGQPGGWGVGHCGTQWGYGAFHRSHIAIYQGPTTSQGKTNATWENSNFPLFRVGGILNYGSECTKVAVTKPHYQTRFFETALKGKRFRARNRVIYSGEG